VHAIWGPNEALLEPIVRVTRLFKVGLECDFGHWTRGLKTVFMERLNSWFSAVKRRARGDRAVE